MNKQQVIDLMSSSRSSKEWNDNCEKIKQEFGSYPPFWFETIVLSGLMNKIQNSWTETAASGLLPPEKGVVVLQPPSAATLRKQFETELGELEKQKLLAISNEDYAEAANLNDKIITLNKRIANLIE
jgi:hypothetical protein